jgi:hypothetical protein
MHEGVTERVAAAFVNGRGANELAAQELGQSVDERVIVPARGASKQVEVERRPADRGDPRQQLGFGRTARETRGDDLGDPARRAVRFRRIRPKQLAEEERMALAALR